MNENVMRSPRTLDIEITSQCNLRCRYCYFFNNAAVDYHDLSTVEWLTFFDELGAAGVMNVVLSGGEPFKRLDLRQIVEGIVCNRMRFSILSNGALIDDDMAAFLAATGRCNYVQISVDGATPETHDAGRGKGAFTGAMRGIEVLQRHSVQVAVRLTIHRFNVYQLAEITSFILNELGLPKFSTNSAGYLGACRLNADDLMLTTTERQFAMHTLLSLEKQYPGRINALAGPLAEGRMWGKMDYAHLTNASPTAKGGYLTACGCYFNKLAVRADGVIIPCIMLPHIQLGRINRDSLLDIWQNSRDLNDLRNRRSIPLSQFSFCDGCVYINYCTGNCPGLAYTHMGEVNHPSPEACLRNYLADGGKLVSATKTASTVS